MAQAEGSAVLTVPADDVLDGEPDDDVLADLVRHRERFTPEDMLAVAFNGLARRRMRGSMIPGEERWPHWRPTFEARRKLVSTFEGHQWAVPSADAQKAQTVRRLRAAVTFSVGRLGLEPSTLGLKVPCSTR